jgi:predicted enzyme related to lactoylglutathione lyase
LSGKQEEETMPTSTHGKICYIELPATDVARSASFFQTIFGWSMREHEGGATSFDDPTGGVSGMFVTGKKAVADPGFIVSIMVDDIRTTIQQIEDFGCEIVRPLGFHPTELIAHFRDPGGNLLGLYQEPG